MKRRNTPATQEILEILSTSGYALSQENIVEEMAEPADRVTVYRVLNRFCEDGLIHRIVADDGKTYFAVCLDCGKKKHHHDHFHFRCLGCQQLSCLKEHVKVKMPKGYRLKEVNCLLTGYCKNCA